VRRLMARLAAAGIVAVLAIAATGCGSSTNSEPSSSPTQTTYVGASGGSDYSDDEYYPYDDAQDAWDNEDGPDWEAFNDAYASGWDEGCDEAFSGSPDGYLYDQGEQFSADDCYANNPGDASSASDVPLYVPDDPEYEGEELGMHDGCVSAFDDLGYDGALFYGDDAYDSSDCP
jgi:hypothetical protein